MYYSKVGGLPAKELANLEIHMLRMLDFRLDISTPDFITVEHALIVSVERLHTTHDCMETPASGLVRKAYAQLTDAGIITALPTSPLLEDRLAALQPATKPQHTHTHVKARAPQGNGRDYNHTHKSGGSPPTSPVTCDSGSETLSRNSSVGSMAETCTSCVVESSAARATVEATGTATITPARGWQPTTYSSVGPLANSVAAEAGRQRGASVSRRCCASAMDGGQFRGGASRPPLQTQQHVHAHGHSHCHSHSHAQVVRCARVQADGVVQRQRQVQSLPVEYQAIGYGNLIPDEHGYIHNRDVRHSAAPYGV